MYFLISEMFICTYQKVNQICITKHNHLWNNTIFLLSKVMAYFEDHHNVFPPTPCSRITLLWKPLSFDIKIILRNFKNNVALVVLLGFTNVSNNKLATYFFLTSSLLSTYLPMFPVVFYLFFNSFLKLWCCEDANFPLVTNVNVHFTFRKFFELHWGHALSIQIIWSSNSFFPY